MKAKSLLSTMLPPLLCASFVSGQVGVNTRNPVGVFHVDGKKDNNTTGIPTLQQQLNDFIITASGSVGIGTVNPDTSAALDMSSIKNKGILIPIITLTSNTDQTTIPLTKTGLLIYNTGMNAGLPTAGYLFWNGTEWRRLDNTSTAVLTPAITGLNCSSASLSPGTFTAGTAYTGTLIVPYTGGNGASYPSAASIAANGLSFTLQAGTLSLGDGQLVYAVGGTPTVSSPSTISVPITFGGQNCSAAAGSTASPVKNLRYGTRKFTFGSSNFQDSSTTTLGSLQVRLNVNPMANGNCYLAFRFTDAARTTVLVGGNKTSGQNSTYLSGGGGSYAPAQNAWTQITVDNIAPNITLSDMVTLQIFDLNNGVIYRINIAAKTSGSGSTTTPGQGAIFIESLEP